jgi:hypothetical protein
LLAARVAGDPAECTKVIEAANTFEHIGLEVVSEVPIAAKNHFAAVVTLQQKIKRLTGQQLRMSHWGGSHARSA